MPVPSAKAQNVLDELRRNIDRQAMVSLQGCAHCGLCTDQCHYVLTHPGDPTYAPAYKADSMRKLFKAHLGWTGRVFPWWVGARKLYSDDELEQLKDVVFGRCTNCQRCSINCPMGVDMAGFNRFARGLLTHTGVMPVGFAEPAQDQWEIGNELGMLPEEYRQAVEWIEAELRTQYKDRTIRLPLEKTGADVVYAISAREVKYDPRTLADAAGIFAAAGENWTLAGSGWDVTNFGLFNGDADLTGAVSARLAEAVGRLGAKKLVVSEWGYGLRSARFKETSGDGRTLPFEIESFVVTMLRYIEQGRIRVVASRNARPVTYHDPCTAARGFGMISEPRQLLKLVSTEFREMQPNGAQNFCCTGGGGALFMSEYNDRRLASAKVKAEQLRATGAKIVATSCQNCADSLAELIRHYELDMEVELLVNLVSRALVTPAVRSRGLMGRRILVVSSDAGLRRQVSGILRLAGSNALEATDEETALASSPLAPELIVVDLDSGEAAGELVYLRFKADRRLAAIPAIVVTERASIDRPFGIAPRRLLSDGVARPEGFVNRPVNPEVLIETIRRLVKRRAMGQER